MPRSRSQVGRLSCRKGKVFEREVVRRFCAAGLPAERGYHQARGGHEECDVVVAWLWIECGHGASVTGEAKLKQAVRDEAAKRARIRDAGEPVSTRKLIPIAVTRRNGQRAVLATLRFGDLSRLIEHEELPNLDHDLPVTVALSELLPLIAAWSAWRFANP